MKIIYSALAISCFFFSFQLQARQQLLLSIAPEDSSTLGVLTGYEKEGEKLTWKKTFDSIPVNYGAKGLAWGRGLHTPQSGLQKKEGDQRAPAGRFRVGFAMGYEPQLPPRNRGWTYHQVTERDAWIDDPAIPHLYNHLYTLKPGETPPPWFESQRKRLGDFAYAWKLLIEHNYTSPIPGEGSAIFFHIRRGETRPSVGCTVMEKSMMEKLLCWLNPKSESVEYVLLTQKNYERLKTEWNLP